LPFRVVDGCGRNGTSALESNMGHGHESLVARLTIDDALHLDHHAAVLLIETASLGLLDGDGTVLATAGID